MEDVWRGCNNAGKYKFGTAMGNGQTGDGAVPLDVMKSEARRSRWLPVSCLLHSFDDKSYGYGGRNGK